jgi:hypothetical protein
VNETTIASLNPTMLEALDNEDYLRQLIAWHLEAELKRYAAEAPRSRTG